MPSASTLRIPMNAPPTCARPRARLSGPSSSANPLKPENSGDCTQLAPGWYSCSPSGRQPGPFAGSLGPTKWFRLGVAKARSDFETVIHQSQWAREIGKSPVLARSNRRPASIRRLAQCQCRLKSPRKCRLKIPHFVSVSSWGCHGARSRQGTRVSARAASGFIP
jgi:hypothetical protein